MLERDILIDGKVWHTHELALATLIPNQEIVVTVRSHDGDTLIETSHSLPWVDGMQLDAMEEAVWALPEFEEYVDKGEILDNVLDILTDEQAETVPQAFPEWAADISYAVGKRVRYDDKLYRCVQAHTSQEGWEPPNVPSLWVRTAAEGDIPEWVQPTGAHDAYNTGDKVTHNGKTWESDMDANTYEPGVYGWTEVISQPLT